MNNKRREELKEFIEEIGAVIGEVELIRDEEQAYLDKMPENIQYGDRGIAAADSIENIENAINYLRKAESELEEAIENKFIPQRKWVHNSVD